MPESVGDSERRDEWQPDRLTADNQRLREQVAAAEIDSHDWRRKFEEVSSQVAAAERDTDLAMKAGAAMTRRALAAEQSLATVTEEHAQLIEDYGKDMSYASGRLLAVTEERDKYRQRTHEIQAAESKRNAKLESDVAHHRRCRDLAAEAVAGYNADWAGSGPPGNFWGYSSQNTRDALTGLVEARLAAEKSLAAAERERDIWKDETRKLRGNYVPVNLGGREMQATIDALTAQVTELEGNLANLEADERICGHAKALAAAEARVTELEGQRDELRDRLDMVLPPLTPEFEGVMTRLDHEVARLARYENAETGKMSTPAASRERTLDIIQIARHMLRYANDAESGNAALRESFATAEHRIEELTAERDAAVGERERYEKALREQEAALSAWEQRARESAAENVAMKGKLDASQAVVEAAEGIETLEADRAVATGDWADA